MTNAQKWETLLKWMHLEPTTTLKHVQAMMISGERPVVERRERQIAYAIEFRSGGFFSSDESEHSVTVDFAKKFATMEKAKRFMDRYERRDWILMHGGMVKRVSS